MLFDREGNEVKGGDVIEETARFLDTGAIVAVRGIGGFHIACIEEAAGELRDALGRSEQPFAIMVRTADYASRIAKVFVTESPPREFIPTDRRSSKRDIRPPTMRSATSIPSAACCRIPVFTTVSSPALPIRSLS